LDHSVVTAIFGSFFCAFRSLIQTKRATLVVDDKWWILLWLLKELVYLFNLAIKLHW